jgi:hypothetical protein
MSHSSLSINEVTNKNEEKMILDSFIQFLLAHNLKSELSSNEENQFDDNILASYVINMIKQFYEEYESSRMWLDEKKAQNFEIENFKEIMDAYISDFKLINDNDIIEWLIELKKRLDDLARISKISSNKLKSEEKITKDETIETNNLLNDNNSNELKYDKNMQLLIEMFPNLNAKDIGQVYNKTNQNYEKAIDNLLIMDKACLILDSKQESYECESCDLTQEEKKLLKERTVRK